MVELTFFKSWPDLKKFFFSVERSKEVFDGCNNILPNNRPSLMKESRIVAIRSRCFMGIKRQKRVLNFNVSYLLYHGIALLITQFFCDEVLNSSSPRVRRYMRWTKEGSIKVNKSPFNLLGIMCYSRVTKGQCSDFTPVSGVVNGLKKGGALIPSLSHWILDFCLARLSSALAKVTYCLYKFFSWDWMMGLEGSNPSCCWRTSNCCLASSTLLDIQLNSFELRILSSAWRILSFSTIQNMGLPKMNSLHTLCTIVRNWGCSAKKSKNLKGLGLLLGGGIRWTMAGEWSDIPGVGK